MRHILTTNEHNVLSILSDAIGTGIYDNFSKNVTVEDWDSIFDELKIQSVLPLVAESIIKFNPPQEILDKIVLYTSTNIQAFYNYLESQEEFLEIFRNANITVAILKGSAAAVNYPCPEFRIMGDVDILVSPEQYDQAYKLMLANGFTEENENDLYTRHKNFRKPCGIELELHRFFSSSDNKKQNKILDDFLFDGLKGAQINDIYGYEVPIFPALQNGIVLLGHINQHLFSGLGLRQILDWMFFVEKHLDDELWENGFADIADKIGMKKLAITVTAMCQKYFGLKRNITFTQGHDEELVTLLMEYIMSQGNFGRKNELNSQKTKVVMHYFTNPVKAVKYLHDAGQCHWRAAQKHKVLAPLACFYQIGHLIKKGLNRKASTSMLISEHSQMKYDSELLKRLEVTRMS